jgi:hypothetical protein
MRRIVTPTLMTLMLLVALAAPAAAGSRVWCARDPDVLLERSLVKVLVSVPEEYLPLVNGPTWLRFNIPSGVDRQLVATDAGFNNLGYTVTFSTSYEPNKWVSKFSVNLTVKVPIRDGTKVPLQVIVTLPDGATCLREGNDAKTGTSVNFTMYGTP